jgi:hypothetical protein
MELGDMATWATAVIAAIAIVFSYLAHREARTSRKSNDKWQQTNAEAAVRSANAAEQALTLQMQATKQVTGPAPSAQTPTEITWRLERPQKNRFVLRNTGSGMATGVTIDPDQFGGFARQLPKGVAVRKGASTEFLVLTANGHPHPNEIWVTWDGVDEPVALPVPAW